MEFFVQVYAVKLHQKPSNGPQVVLCEQTYRQTEQTTGVAQISEPPLKTLHSAHTVYLCVLYGSHNKQRLFPQIAFTGWAL
jgi:hypothetical protein